MYPSVSVENKDFEGKKNYELSNHLGNILAVFSDRKKGMGSIGGNYAYFDAVTISATDYYPFGMAMPGRTYNTEGYRYSFNGKEDDAEWAKQDYGARMYDKRICRFLSIDPITQKYPNLTPFQFASNTPIQAIDLDGLEGVTVVSSQWLNSNGAMQENSTESIAPEGFAVQREGVELILHNYDGRTTTTFIEPVSIIEKRIVTTKLDNPDGRLTTSIKNEMLYFMKGTGYAAGIVSDKQWTDYGQANREAFENSAKRVAAAEITGCKMSAAYALALLTGGGGNGLLALQTQRSAWVANAGFEFIYQVSAAEGSFTEKLSQVNVTNVVTSATFTNPIVQAAGGTMLQWSKKGGYQGIGNKSFSWGNAMNSTLIGGSGNAIGDLWKVGEVTPNMSKNVSTAFDALMQTYLGNAASDGVQPSTDDKKD